jgi:hypothetical protein
MANRTDVNRSSRDVRGIIVGGGLAGIIAGIAMAIFAMGYAGMMGMGFLAPLRLIAATLYGVEALIGGAGVLMVGLIIHILVSAMFGIIFAALLSSRASGRAAFASGLVYGVVVWAVMRWGVVSWADPTMAVRLPMMAAAFFIEHLVFGGVLAITPGLVRRWSRIRPLAEVRPYPERRVA